jgi:SAM-dependent methyltransferase
VRDFDGLVANEGTGPGVITPDGCAVEFYSLLQAGPEPEIIHAAAGSEPASILELGAGAGRVTAALTALGHSVVAVDESSEMLARVRGAETICASIEGLRLRRRFDVVLLASFLIHAPSAPVRAAFLETCARHVSDSGCVIIQQHPPAWFASVTDAERQANGITIRLKDVSRPAPDLVTATAEYEIGERAWTHSFTARRLGEPALRSVLAGAGLALDRYLTADHQWLRAVPGGSE